MIIESSIDILYLSLSFVIIMIGFLGATIMLQVINILRDVRRITKGMSQALSIVAKFIFKPLSYLHFLSEVLLPFMKGKKNKWKF